MPLAFHGHESPCWLPTPPPHSCPASQGPFWACRCTLICAPPGEGAKSWGPQDTDKGAWGCWELLGETSGLKGSGCIPGLGLQVEGMQDRRRRRGRGEGGEGSGPGASSPRGRARVLCGSPPRFRGSTDGVWPGRPGCSGSGGDSACARVAAGSSRIHLLSLPLPSPGLCADCGGRVSSVSRGTPLSPIPQPACGKPEEEAAGF